MSTFKFEGSPKEVEIVVDPTGEEQARGEAKDRLAKQEAPEDERELLHATDEVHVGFQEARDGLEPWDTLQYEVRSNKDGSFAIVSVKSLDGSFVDRSDLWSEDSKRAAIDAADHAAEGARRGHF